MKSIRRRTASAESRSDRPSRNCSTLTVASCAGEIPGRGMPASEVLVRADGQDRGACEPVADHAVLQGQGGDLGDVGPDGGQLGGVGSTG